MTRRQCLRQSSNSRSSGRFRDKKLTVEAVHVLRKVLHDGSIMRQLEDPGVSLCHEMGWLHSEATDHFADNILCVFPTKLHEK